MKRGGDDESELKGRKMGLIKYEGNILSRERAEKVTTRSGHDETFHIYEMVLII